MANRRPKLRVQLLSAAFGLGSWIAMTGLWVELPVLVQRLPEGWALPSQLALYLQVANIGPIAYGFCHHWWPKYVTEEAANHLQLAIGALSTLLVIFMWTWTASGISFAFFLLSFGLSLVDCTSSVTFLPYMANFRACYLTPYLVGEGLSGLLPSLVAMAQGIEDPTCVNETRITFSAETGQNVTFFEMIPHVNEPRFSPEWFFGFLLALVIVSWLAFIALDKMPLCQAERVPSTEGNNSHDQAHELESLNELQKNDVSFKNGDVIIRNAPHSHLLYYYLLFLQGWASVATFGIFPALQSYSCLPYGDGPFHLTVTLCGVAYPAACLFAMFVEMRRVSWISWTSLAATLISLYALVTAVLSPHPPLHHTLTGAILIVVCWVTFMFTFSYIKTMVTILLEEFWGHRALFWCGAVTQAGAAAGALLMFLLVNVFNLFEDENMCLI
ncbi:solute carrier family 52, riboflavin transporter, member 3-A-like isoform X1 [Uloborus diversus]|uniref:solute carrier family 52, riboflavin transporter, member 3-A-like isoform X1 n=1 Tax=Uloborus diversus TaxID=327109 RepID=UPI0024092881|nr:solute carrier family 52, riboflavin transporter, member 3-A-like isoform X1 [Uloborus diversus]XP_054724487.1 solute carrier family 52, riboflavin transporter, member 3-A-like isoform X1 [Uloborus diversus]XP_054724488.1 solute carrier family 52, riboflavin transporter, member 3-A-like isoform X1 [Uloborus diversus]XP_054724489.1 solute carrier family 52, riboflavin transporter, member 3-A-like isoform X1 [Uloborus diversus]